MILVDTSIWVDHLRRGDDQLASLLDDGQVVTHPFVIGELALGYLKPRRDILDFLEGLPKATVAAATEVLHLIDRLTLFGTGISYVDAHLLASARLTYGISIWTRDKHLIEVAGRVGLAASPARKRNT